VPIGRPIANTEVAVVDQEGRPVPVGVAGELVAGGDGLARGYWRRPDLTAERFRPHPLSPLQGERVYHTGDRARWRTDGRLEFLGRLDRQVKIRGFRIEPGEIEAVLAAHPEVRQAAVTVREDRPGDRRLVAYVAGTSPEMPGMPGTPGIWETRESELLGYLAERLPGYMVPAAIVRLPALPLTRSGKVDRAALPAPEGRPGRPAAGRPRTPAEELMAGLWEEVLGIDGIGGIGPGDGFFELGGHSLLATRLVSRIRETFGVDLPLRAVFDDPTLAGLAAAAERALTAGLGVEAPPLLPVPLEGGDLPLSFGQERLWFFDQLEPGSAAYNIPFAVRLRGHLRPAALAASLAEIVRRHEALRTTFAAAAGRARQVRQMIAPPAPLPLPTIDLGSLPEAERRSEAERLILAEALRPFDLARGPLLRAGLLRLADREHAALFTMHHIVSDGWSMGVLVRELGALYGAALAGRPSPLPELPIQYAEFARRQRHHLDATATAREVAWWRERLAGVPPVLELPADRPRPALPSPRSGFLPLSLPAEPRAALGELSRSSGATLFMTLLASFAALLSRLSGQEVLAVGSPIANRTRLETEGLIGYFVNTLVLPAGLSGEPSFRELLGRIRETTLGAYAHQELPFEKLVAELQPERSLAHAPLFQVMFNLENASRVSLAALEWPDLTLERIAVAPQVSMFDLNLTWREDESGLKGALDYSRDLFDATTVQRFSRYLRNLQAAAVADPARPVSALPLLSAAERHELLHEWQEPALPPGEALSLPQLFEAQAALRPGAPALATEGGEELTYGELDRRAGTLARHLRRRGVGPEVPVGICLPRSLDLVVALLAVWKAGGVYLPLDPAYPRERLALMLADSGAPWVLTREPWRAHLPADPASGVGLLLLEALESEPVTPISIGAAEPGSLAYVIYTSGSTGRPKGVGVEQRTAVRHMEATVARFRLGPGDRFCHFVSPSFDVALEEIVAPLVSGATVVVHDAELWEPEQVLARGRDLRLTVLSLPTALWARWARELADTEGKDVAGLPLRLVLVGGEAMPVEAVRHWFAGPLAGTGLHNGYGPTEAVITATWWQAEPGAPGLAAGAAPIGRPLAGHSIHLLDVQGQQGQPVPLGVPGELYLGGFLARGYLGNPAATAERYLPDPFAAEGGARLYRTGDLASRLADGNVRFLGRTDGQVKVRGFRIELGEIEAALAQHPGVAVAVVLVREERPGDPRLVAFLVPAEGEGGPGRDELREHLHARLPEYMCPALFVPLPALPLTPNSKVDRRALARLRPAREEAGEEASERPSAAPRTPVEEELAAIWGPLLGVERLGIDDNFFSLGGHSLLATQAMSRVRQAFAVELPLRALFEAPTIAGLAREIEAAQGAAPPGRRTAAPPLLATRRTAGLPLSFAQERLWFLDQLEPGGAAYNMPGALRLRGRLDPEALAASLSEIVRRHAALRVIFTVPEADGDGRPVQSIVAALALALPRLDLSGLPAAVREGELRRLALAEAGRPFDLTRGPLLRATLLRLEEDEHAVLFTLHHIVSDGWSMEVLVRELGALYGSRLAGRPSPLPELALQYPDFALWQRGYLTGEVLEGELAYWREALAGLPTLDLPADRPRPPVRRGRGALHRFGLPAVASGGLERLSRAAGATPFMTLLAGFTAFLTRYTGQDDVAVGTPIANRTRREIEGLIGFFVNTLVLRTRAAGEPAFRQLLGNVRQNAIAAFQHQEVPFERVVEELSPERDPSRTPLFQVMFLVPDPGREPLALPGLTLETIHVAGETAKFDLTLGLAEGPAGLAGSLEYDRDLFEPATIARLASHLEALLAAALAEPDRRVAELPLLAPAERHQLLAEWNEGWAEELPPSCLHELFARQASSAPDAPAVVYEGERLTYRELLRGARRLGRYLAGLGVGPGSLVGLCLPRSLDLVVAILGVLEAGAAYVPLDPGYPRERLAFVLADSGLSVLLSHSALVAELPPLPRSVEVVRLDAERERIGFESAEALPARATPGDLAYVIYTSGSTGRPKGVGVRHTEVSRLLTSTAGWFGFGPADVWTLFHSYAFDFSVWEIWGCLGYGGRLVVVPYWSSRSPESFRELLARERVTVLNQTPSAFQELIRAEESALAEGAGELDLRLVIFGGEALEIASLAPWWERHADERPRLVNMYGITETTVHVTYRALGRRDLEARGSGSGAIGRPIPDLAVHLLDRGFEPVPIGVAGEIHVGGAGLALGYLGRPERTAERFVPDPWGGRPGARLYRSGDLARQRTDGSLDYLGRIDQQVKVRGFRIELGEIEVALLAHPAVAQAVVILREEESGERRLAASVVARPGEELEVSALRGFLRDRLPEYMVPAGFALLPALPFTANGKVDRRALARLHPATAEATTGGEGSFAAPRTPVEELLAGIWEDLLGRERVGIDDGFFDLGGHSLLATRAISRVRQAFGVELPLRTLFEVPTIAGLAREIEIARNAGRRAAAPPLVAAGTAGLPLSFAQERLWFLDQLDPGSPAYNLPAPLLLRGRLAPPALAASFAEIVRRHEALRTTFALEAGAESQPVQVIAPAIPPTAPGLPLVDLAGLPAGARAKEGPRLATAETRRPFDLARGPLLRVSLVRLAADEHLLLLNLHHIVADGWSMGVLIAELGALYPAFLAGRPAALPALPLQYADFALWQRRWLSGEVLGAEIAWWQEALADLPALDLPADHPRPPRRSGRGGLRRFTLPREQGEALARLSRAEGGTLFMTLLAGLAALLSRQTGAEDLAVGSPIANRTQGEVEGLIGFFVNTLVLRCDLTGDPEFRELLGRMRQTALGAYAHQDLPFEKVVEALAPARDPSRTPLFQVLFALQNAPRESLTLPGLELLPAPAGWQSAKFDLTLTLSETPAGLAGAWEYSRDLFEAPTISRLGEQLARLLAAAAAEPGTRLADLPLLSPAERHQLLQEWRSGETEHPRLSTVHGLFAEQAARRPDAAAVVFGDAVLSYREAGRQAGRRARRLAGRLAELGVGPEARVGLLLEHPVERVLAMLAILLAGGAYVPLDPSHPKERLGFLLADTAAVVVVAEEGLRGRLPADTAARLCLDLAAEGEPAEGESISAAFSAPPFATGASLAHVLYTSGSTGTPKGVAVTHRGVVRLARETGYVRFGAGDRVAQVANPAFDAATFEIWGALVNGAALVVVEREVALAPERLAADLAARQVSVLLLTTALFNQVAREAPAAFRPLTRLFFGGEAADPPSVRRVLAASPAARLINAYGPTENTTISTCYPVKAVPAEAVTVPIGGPIANSTAEVLDRGGRPVPIGVPGELFVGGDGLARGYIGRPDLTAERFVPGPLGERLYRTGDLARFLPSGALEFLGRGDQQVKIRGFRIEPGEIEAALSAHPAVGQAAVLFRQEAGGKRLTAYVAPLGAIAAEPGVTAGELRAFLRERLPEPMVPAAFVLLDRLPITANGKLDRRALAALRPAAEEPGEGPSAALRTPIDEMLSGIWGELLGRERVGIDDSFFDLGGHSLLATQAMSRVRQAFGIELPLRTLFEVPTIAGLAREIESAQGAGRGAAPPPLAAAMPGALPLSFAQERLWFLDQLGGAGEGRAAYNLPLPVRLSGTLEPAVLAAALGEEVRRHAVLRTTFRIADGQHRQPVQVVAPSLSLDLPLLDLSGLPGAVAESEASRLATAEAARPFDLERGPVIRAILLRVAAAEHVLLLTLHHIAGDGWSLGVLIREVAALYGAFLAGRPSPLPELAVQYADYAVWQRGWLQGEVLERELGYWRERLAGAPEVLDLPLDRPRPAVHTFHGARRAALLSPASTAGLSALSRRSGATLFMTLLAAWQALLSRHTGQLDVVVGTPIANRTRSEVEGLIGFFVNTLALRTDLSGRPGFAGLLSQARETALGAYSHQEVPFEKLVAELAPERHLDHTPLFQVMLVLGERPAELPELPGLRLGGVEAGNQTAKFDLTLIAEGGRDGLGLRLGYNSDLFFPPTVDRLLAHLVILVEGALAEPERPVAELPLLSAAERHQLLLGWNDTAGERTGEGLDDLFAAQALRRSDAVALVAGEAVLTYGELDRRAERLAGRLAALGVGPEERV
ncbi:MAG: hypothetical protein QOJ16_870, partial [Acidobacteriota bacterium]|nr:hypothetical protein [Acidobacteriota bacterium]